MKLQKIKFLEGVTEYEEAVGGYSSAQKLIFEKEGKKYFLKIGKLQIRDDLEQLFSWAEIPHPKVVESGVFDQENKYIIEEFFDGQPLKNKLDNFDVKFVYEFGFKIGEKYRNLRKKFPDKAVSDDFYLDYMKNVDQRIERLSLNMTKNKDKFSKKQIDFLNYIIKFLVEKRQLVKNSIMVFGHTDIKPSNFLIDDRNIVVIDFEHTDYKELSLSLIWSYSRASCKDEKNFAFANGYLDGLFNFNVPQNFLSCCNYTYLYNMSNYLSKYIENGEFEKFENLINHIKQNYIKNGQIKVDKSLINIANINDFKMIKGYEMNLKKGSYSPNNLTFSCKKGDKKYFLKIMKIGKSSLEQSLNYYNLMQSLGISISPVRGYGQCKNRDRYWVLYDYIDYPEMHKTIKNPCFEEGFKHGQIVAKNLIKLKECKLTNIKVYDKTDIYNNLLNEIDLIYEEEEISPFIKYNKHQSLEFIKKYIKCFDEEKIALIHGDVKFGNILFDGKDEVVFVDNESLMRSYDIINFLYNIFSGFNGSNIELYQGFVNGYLKYMNNGEIPERITGQVRLLIFARLLREIKNMKKASASDARLCDLNELCEKYVENEEEIEWLK